IEFSMAGLTQSDVQRSLGSVPCATASQLFGGAFREKLRIADFEPFGVYDTFGVNAIDPTGRGTALVGLLPQVSRAGAGVHRVWSKTPAHLAAARRLRAALTGPLGGDPAREERVEAIVSPQGKLEYAATPEVQSARAKLVDAVDGVERALGRRRPTEPN